MNVEIKSPHYHIDAKKGIGVGIAFYSNSKRLTPLEARAMADALIEAADISEGKEWDHLYGRPCPHCGAQQSTKAERKP